MLATRGLVFRELALTRLLQGSRVGWNVPVLTAAVATSLHQHPLHLQQQRQRLTMATAASASAKRRKVAAGAEPKAASLATGVLATLKFTLAGAEIDAETKRIVDAHTRQLDR